MNDTSISEAIKNLVKGILSGVHTCMPAQVDSYDPAKQKATVKPLLKRAYADGKYTVFPSITDVPVIFPRSGKASLTLPVNAGDTVMLVFAERSMDQWLIKGGEAETKLESQFDLSDAVAIPGLFPFTENSHATDNTHVTLYYDNFKISIDNTGKIAIGKGGVELLKVLSDLIQALITATTATPAGPQPLSCSLDGTLSGLKTSLDSIRSTL